MSIVRQFAKTALLIGALMLAQGFTGQAWAKASIMFILDVSGSMAAKLEGQRKIVLAKKAFNEMLDGLPADTHAGLYVYGHYGNRDCDAVEKKLPLGVIDKPRMRGEVDKLKALHGATPLTKSLMAAVGFLGDYKQPGQKSIVLLSDGEENCGGDPVAFANKAGKMLGDLVKIYVVGFDVGDKERAQLEGVAKAGHGAYFDAANAAELTAALNKVTAQVVKTSIFEDDFDTAKLKPDWTLVGDAPDSRTLADGNFVLVTEPGAPEADKAQNMLLYKAPIAEKNYDVSLAMSIDIQSYRSDKAYWTRSGIILHQSKDVLISLHVANAGGAYQSSTGPWAIFTKRTSGKTSKPLQVQLGRSGPVGELGFHLRLEKRGFKYTGFVSLDGEKWSKIGTHALLGKKLTPGLFAYRGDKAVEAVTKFDRFEIQKVTK